MAATYDVGTKAWQPDVTEGWVASEVEQKNLNGDKVTLVFQLANGEVSPPQELLLRKSRR
jgi:myosin-5